MYRILIIDDSPADCEEMGRRLTCFGVERVTAMSLKSAKELLKKSSYRDIIICDYKLPDGTSVELLEWLAKNRIYRDVIVVSDMPDNPLSIEAFRAGAKDYIQKRQTDQLLIPRLKRLIGGGFKSEYKSVVLPRSSVQFNEIQRIIARIAPIRLNVLITGEGGCGKEPLAQEIYRKSDRSDRPCIVIDSAMLPLVCPPNNKRTAYQMVEDYFAKAEHGTVILDHIHLLSFDMQTMILNILDRQRPDIRLIATTHASDIAERVNKGEFRYEHIVDFEEAGFDNLDVLVQFEVTARAAFRHGALLVPVLRDDAAAEVHLRNLTADGDTDKDWILAVAEGAGFPCYKRQGKIRIM